MNTVSTNLIPSLLLGPDGVHCKDSCFSSLKEHGIHIGFELESKKAQKNSGTTLCSDIHDEETRSIATPSTTKSTPKTTNGSADRSSISQERSLLGKRKYCPLIEGCNAIENYTFKFTDKIYAVKKVKFNYQKEGFPITSLREINLLQTLRHPNIVNIKEVCMGKSLDQIYLIMEYAEHELRDLIQNYNVNFSMPEIKGLMKQLLQAINYLHSHDIVHRDLKTSNLLYTQKGLLKVCDFGLSRKMAGSKRSYTPTVVTLTYRAPEVLLGCDRYTSAIDMWSVGCIFAELLLREPLFRGKGEMEQIDLIFKTLGTPTTAIWPGWKQLKYARFFEGKNYTVNRLYEIFAGLSFGEKVYLSEDGLELLERLLTYDPTKRITAAEALKHPWFMEEPLPKRPEEMQVFPDTNDMPRETGKKLVK